MDNGRLPGRRMVRFRAMLGWMVLMIGLPLPTVFHEASADEVAEASLYTMTPDEFAASEFSQRELRVGAIDQTILSAAIFHETNRRRSQEGLSPLRHEPALEQAARMHADAMAEGGYLSHEQPDPARRTPMDRVRLAGFEPTYVAENVATAFALQYESGQPIYRVEGAGGPAFSYEPGGPLIPPHTYASFARALLDQWMQSPGHRDNILSQQAEALGAAAVPGQAEMDIPKLYGVQVFAAP